MPKNKSGTALTNEINKIGIRKWNFARIGEDGTGKAIIIIIKTNWKGTT